MLRTTIGTTIGIAGRTFHIPQQQTAVLVPRTKYMLAVPSKKNEYVDVRTTKKRNGDSFIWQFTKKALTNNYVVIRYMRHSGCTSTRRCNARPTAQADRIRSRPSTPFSLPLVLRTARLSAADKRRYARFATRWYRTNQEHNGVRIIKNSSNGTVR